MYLNDLGIFGINFNPPTPSIKPTSGAAAGKAVGKSTGGFFSNFDRFLTGAQKTADAVIQTKLQLQQMKQAFNPAYGQPVATPGGYTIQAPGATGQRFVPQTTIVQPQQTRSIAATSPDKLSQSEILLVQRKLQEKGFNPGPLDGLFGPKTSAAIRNFQQANSLPATGVLTYSLLDRLTYTPSNPAAISNNPSAPVQSSYPQPVARTGSGALPYYPSPQPPAPIVKQALPSWAIPAGIGAAGLLVIAVMGSQGRRR